jgi:hypothetical protein
LNDVIVPEAAVQLTNHTDERRVLRRDELSQIYGIQFAIKRFFKVLELFQIYFALSTLSVRFSTVVEDC